MSKEKSANPAKGGANAGRHTVTLLPDGKRVSVSEGMLLQDALRLAGVDADVPCGGQGRCGRCLVRIERGEAKRRPNAHLTDAQANLGWALACQTEVMGDVQVSLPPETVRQQVAVAGKAKIPDIQPSAPPEDPVISQHYLELKPPSLDDNASDLERVRRALASEGVRRLRVELRAMKELQSALREGGWRITVALERLPGGECRLVAARPGKNAGASIGAAIDIGTTTVAVLLVDLKSGKVVDAAASFNKQISCGEDVISRIIYAQKGDGLRHLQRLVRETVNGLIEELCGRKGLDHRCIDNLVVAGNTTMAHLLLGLEPRSIREEPYAPAATHFPEVTALELGLKANPGASVYVVPAVAAYVGGDITAGVLASNLYKSEGMSLFLDIGTNGEMVLGNSEFMMSCACSAGPAFEGAGVKCGMRATTGAIEDVHINSQTLEPTLEVIGEGKPLGICGSGMIAAISELFITGVTDRSGRIRVDHPSLVKGARNRIVRTENGPAYVLAWAEQSGTGEDIFLTEGDIGSLIHTKGAIYAGALVMLRALGIDPAGIDRVLIGGAFGQHINVEKSINIGLMPDLPWEKFHFLGNTAALGAYMLLVSRKARAQVEELAGKMTYMELVADNAFMNEYTSTLFLPHTDMTLFPSVQAMLEALPGQAGQAPQPETQATEEIARR